MRKITCYLIISTFLLMQGCGNIKEIKDLMSKNVNKYVISTIDKNDKINDSVFRPTNDFIIGAINKLPVPTVVGKPEETELHFWKPDKMLDEIELVKLWRFDRKRNDDEWAQSHPDGWVWLPSTTQILVNPKTGEKKRLNNGIGLLEDFENRIKFNYVANQNHSGFECINMDDEQIRWHYPSNFPGIRGVLNNSLYSIEFMKGLIRYDCWTGLPEWYIKATNDLVSVDRLSFTKDYVWVMCSIFPPKDQSELLWKLYRIEPVNLQIVNVDINEPERCLAIGEKLYILSEKGKQISILNPENGIIEQTFNIEDYINKGKLIYTESPLYHPFEVNADDKHFICNIENPSKPIVIENYTEVTELNPFGDRMFYYVKGRDYLQGIDGSTGKKTWRIQNKDLGTNIKILLVDWRGVLVADDQSLKAFGVK